MGEIKLASEKKINYFWVNFKFQYMQNGCQKTQEI